MKLNLPFEISPRLAPGIRVGDGWLSCDEEGFVLDAPAFGELRILGYSPGLSHTIVRVQRTMVDMFSDILSFLSAAAESYRHRRLDWSKVTVDDNAHLFPREVVEWAYIHSDEINGISMTIEEGLEVDGYEHFIKP